MERKKKKKKNKVGRARKLRGTLYWENKKTCPNWWEEDAAIKLWIKK